jgi:hypothetical protein
LSERVSAVLCKQTGDKSMDWDKIASFFKLEAVATYIVGVLSAAFWACQFWKSKRGRHVVCTQSEPVFSHLRLSERAREWVKVAYIGDDQHNPVQINTLGHTVIDIKNESDADALSDVQLKFRVPVARLLKAWWEKGPDYLLDQSSISISLEDGPSTQAEQSAGSSWQIQVFLPDLKSFKKYGEAFRIGILADGNLKTIEMLPGGSKAGCAPDQVWTAKFVCYDDFLKKNFIRESLTHLLWIGIIGAMAGGMMWLSARALIGSSSEGCADLYFLAGWAIGIIAAGILGYISQTLRFMKARIRVYSDD